MRPCWWHFQWSFTVPLCLMEKAIIYTCLIYGMLYHRVIENGIFPMQLLFLCVCVCVCVRARACTHVLSVAKLCLNFCNPMNWSLLGSSVHGIFPARILEWVTISSSRGSCRPRDFHCSTMSYRKSCIYTCLVYGILYHRFMENDIFPLQLLLL